MARLRHEWHHRLDPVEQSAVISWATFTVTFAGLRVLTHWIRAGHGPKGGGISPRRPNLRIAGPEGQSGDDRRHGDLLIRPHTTKSTRPEQS
jgi:hypothetical protein